jgi:hypothetical protein
MDQFSMEKAMLKKMIKKTGKPIEEWIKIVKEKDFFKHGEIVKFLKEQYSVTHGYANLIVRKLK